LPLSEPPLHKTLKIIDFEGFAVLLLREIEKADD
jgi:hypothetical protein